MTLKQDTASYEQTAKADKRKLYIINFILTILFLGGIILTVFEINIYRDTIISWIIPTSIWLLSGLIFIPITSKLLKKYYDTKAFFWQMIFNIGAFGGLLAYSFIALNYYFPTDKEVHNKVQIIKTGHLAKGRHGCGNPYADVRINGVNKELIFPCDFKIEKYNYVLLTVKTGLLGFDIIETKTAVTE